MATAQIEITDADVRDALKERWKTLRIAAVIAIIAGAVAIIVPAIASVATALFVGWIFLFAGSYQLFDAWSVRSAPRVALRLLWGALTVFAGFYLLFAPLRGTITLTFVLCVYFFFIGSTRLMAAVMERDKIPHAGWVAVSGVCAILVGALILASFPSSADWAIGLLVGIELVFAGFGLLRLSEAGKQLAGA